MPVSLVVTNPALLPDSLTIVETLSGIPTLTLSARMVAPLDNVISSRISLAVTDGKQDRPFDFPCTEVRSAPDEGTKAGTRCDLTLRPWLWWLTLVRNNRVFKNKTVIEIVSAIFNAYNFSDFSLKLTGQYQSRACCIQSDETDFAFVSRLLEEEEIFYFFTNVMGRQILVLGDGNKVFPSCSNVEAIPYLGRKADAGNRHGIYNGQMCEQATGLQTSARRFMGESDCHQLVPGHWFILTGHDWAKANIKWLVTAVTHEIRADGYGNRFEAVPFDTAYHLPRVMAKPVMYPQAAHHTVEGDYTLIVKGDFTISVDGNVSLKGEKDFTAKAGGALRNEAGTSLVNKARVSLTNEAGATLTSKATATQVVDGGGMLTLKGGLIKAN